MSIEVHGFAHSKGWKPEAITKKQFDSYVRVQESGVTNMWDFSQVILFSRMPKLTHNQVLCIIQNYDFLKSKYYPKTKKEKMEAVRKKLLQLAGDREDAELKVDEMISLLYPEVHD